MKYFLNEGKKFSPENYSFMKREDVQAFHESIEAYVSTPLLSLPDVAEQLGIKELLIKDESKRFGLNAFKGLGASYAIHTFLLNHRNKPTFCTATDGNHGRAVAWAARLSGCKAVVYVPEYTVKPRIEAIEKEGAKVVLVDGDYDQTVKIAYTDAEKFGMQVIQDTAWHGYTEIPQQIMAGYTTMFREIDKVLAKDSSIDFIFLQAGVGSWAAAATWFFHEKYGDQCPVLICVEPDHAACLLKSFENDKLTEIKTEETIMAGLNCGTPSHTAWSILQEGLSLSLAINDEFTVKAMQLLHQSDPQVIAGESGAAGLGGLIALMEHSEFGGVKQRLQLGDRSRVLVFNTEGDTDPASYRKLVRSGS